MIAIASIIITIKNHTENIISTDFEIPYYNASKSHLSVQRKVSRPLKPGTKVK